MNPTFVTREQHFGAIKDGVCYANHLGEFISLLGVTPYAEHIPISNIY